MKKTFVWTTPRGAKIEATMTVEHITHQPVDADGWDIEVDCDEWCQHVDSLTVNGETTKWADLGWYGGQPVIFIGERVVVEIPEDVKAYLYGEEREGERRRQIAKLEEAKAAAEAQMVEGKLPTYAEVNAKRRDWANVNNEGGDAYVPYWWSQEQYAKICRELEQLAAEK